MVSKCHQLFDAIQNNRRNFHFPQGLSNGERLQLGSWHSDVAWGKQAKKAMG
jgi:hypothetical protein